MKLIATSIIVAISFFGNTWAMEQCTTIATIDLTTKNSLIRVKAWSHNSKTILLSSLSEIRDHVFRQLIDPSEPIEKSIKNSLNLSATCTQLNDLAYFGKLLRAYPIEERNAAMKKWQFKTNHTNYWNFRRAFSLLIHTQAQCNHITSSLQTTAFYNDLEMANLLFHYGANANEQAAMAPVFWSIKTPEMAQLFIDNGVDLHQSVHALGCPNVLWRLRSTEHIKLLEFYIAKGVSPRLLDSENHSILHDAVLSYTTNKKALKFFLTILSDMINHLDRSGKTALDYAYEKGWLDGKKFIELFEKYGAKRSAELT
jgi:hypothetical protein